MSNGIRTLVASLTASATLVLFVSSATGQEIRNYGDQGSDSGGSGGGGQSAQTVYPGQPTPQANQRSGNQQRQDQRDRQNQEGKEGDVTVQSYEIQLHEDSGTDGDRRKSSEKLDRSPNQMYRGIIPGEREAVDHLAEEREQGESPTEPNRLTWIGFQPNDDNTRVFVQMSRQADYSVSRRDDGKRIVVTLENAKVTTGNFRRRIDTRYFDRAVQRIETKVVGDRTIELHISLGTSKPPSVEAKDDYLYVDFAYDNPESDESSESGE